MPLSFLKLRVDNDKDTLKDEYWAIAKLIN